jgi:uncharacterized protein (DUF427 family)
MHPRPDPVRPGQESVWDYPRPPALEPTSKHVRIEVGGQILADTNRALRLLETSHPPTYYLPPEAVDQSLLRANRATSFCEWKGRARYVDVVVPATGERDAVVLPKVGWYYDDPVEQYAALKDHFAFYCAPMDACYVGDVRAEPQPGGFYGGWVTPDLAGPFKGIPGSWGW